MRKLTTAAAIAALVAGTGAAIGVPAVAAPPNPPSPLQSSAPAVPDALPNPLAEKQDQLRQKAIADVANGRAKPQERNGATVVKAGEEPQAANGKARAQSASRDQYVKLEQEGADRVFVVLAEFGDERHPDYPDQDTDPDTEGPATFEGPLHNQIPEPDRTTDNSTVWQADYDREHYQQLYFGTGKGVESLKTYYEKQSSGRYSVDGEVTDWVKVKYNEARYGRSDGYPCETNVCDNTWALLTDALNQWVKDQRAAGRTNAQIKADVKSFDQQDRYDFDGDGDFNEPDGYIDHFQIVHAGGDQADGDPQQGEDAIWSHRWYAYYTDEGKTGPANNKLGGTQIGNTGLWVGDYTIQPENGGLSVFAHEFGHDLGLPDHYDTAGGSNGVEHWTLMAQSRLNAKGEALGTRPGDLGAWDKLQLGWLDYEIVPAGQTQTLDLGPHEYNSAKAQAVVMPLPQKEITTDLGAPAAGSKQWWSTSGDDLDTTLTSPQVTLASGTSTLAFKARWNIEDCGTTACDYAYVEVDDGSGFTAVPGSITRSAEGNGIDGLQATWTDATFDMSSYAGKQVRFRFRYATDGAAQGQDPTKTSGLFVDDVTLTSGGKAVVSDGAEGGGPLVADGFSAVGATSTESFDNFYIASNRSYVSYDKYLKTGPYNFGWLNTLPNKVEHFAYEQGLLVTYWDTSQTDNNTSVHPGSGLILPIDSRPQAMFNIEGQPWRSRVQVYDAPFGLTKAGSFTLHVNGKASYVRGRDAVPTFDDRRSYWDARIPQVGVKVPDAGVQMRVVSQDGTSMRVRIGSTKKS